MAADCRLNRAKAGDARRRRAYCPPMPSEHRLMPFLAAFAGVGMLSLMDAFMKGASLAAGAYSAAVLRAAL